MFNDFFERLRDPRIRLPLLGTIVCCAAWIAVYTGVMISGMASGGDANRAIAVALTLAPLFGATVFFIALYRRADEVERAFYNTAAATGFVVMLLAAVIGMHLEVFDTGMTIDSRMVFASGMLGWLAGLTQAWVRSR